MPWKNKRQDKRQAFGLGRETPQAAGVRLDL